jgi:hypothetical protein
MLAASQRTFLLSKCPLAKTLEFPARLGGNNFSTLGQERIFRKF